MAGALVAISLLPTLQAITTPVVAIGPVTGAVKLDIRSATAHLVEVAVAAAIVPATAAVRPVTRSATVLRAPVVKLASTAVRPGKSNIFVLFTSAVLTSHQPSQDRLHSASKTYGWWWRPGLP